MAFTSVLKGACTGGRMMGSRRSVKTKKIEVANGDFYNIGFYMH